MLALSSSVFASATHKSFDGLLNLSFSFLQYGRHNRLIDYLAQSDVTNFDAYVRRVKALENRAPLEDSPNMGYSPRESTRFKTAFNLMATNNRSYEIAIKVNPSCEDIDEFIKRTVGFTTAYTGKKYLMNHPEMCREYRGLVPFGGPVRACFNSMVEDQIKGTPDLRDHFLLRDMTNMIADQLGMTTMAVNNWMHIVGTHLMKTVHDPAVDAV